MPIKPSERIRERKPAPASSWKDSPLVVAIVSAGAMATFMGTVVVPLTTSYLSAKVDRLTEISANASATAEELERTKKELATARGDLATALRGSPFSAGSVYPNGLDRVVIGSSAEQVLQVFPNAKWDEDHEYLSVDTKLPTFISAAYYFHTDAQKVQRVDAILFQGGGIGDTTFTSEYVRARLTVLFGEPLVNKRDAFWKAATPRESIEISSLMVGQAAYEVRRADYLPLWLRKQ